MQPIIPVGSIELSTYALMLCAGACVSFCLTLLEVRRTGLDRSALATLTAIVLAAGIAGARGTSGILNRGFSENAVPYSLATIWDPAGMWFFGGFMVAGLTGLTWALVAGIQILQTADTLATSWVPFISFIRVGCFLNGCCYGRPTTSTFGLVAGGSRNNVNFGIPSHPTQLYAVVATLAIFVVLWRRRRRRRFTGELTVIFLLLYPAFVFVHEFLRGDPRPAWSLGTLGVLTLNQIVSLLLIVTGIILWRTLSLRNKRRPPIHPTTASPEPAGVGAR